MRHSDLLLTVDFVDIMRQSDGLFRELCFDIMSNCDVLLEYCVLI
jgi:hypothetical protein